MESKLSVYLVDDHHLVRAGIKALIDDQRDMNVVGEAGDGRLAWAEIVETGPEIVIMDITMPGMNGAEATQRIKQDRPETKVIALTVHEDQGYLEQLVRAGASGYLLKRAVADDLIHAIRTVAQGRTYLDPSIQGIVVESLKRTGTRKDPTGAQLSDRETEVLQLNAKGYTNREVAARLDVSSKTIETHKARAMEKLGLSSRADIVRYAQHQGWLQGL